MKQSQGRSQPEWRSARLAKTKRRIDVGDKLGSIQLGEVHSSSGLEDERIIVEQVEVVVTLEPDRASLDEPEVEEEVEGTRRTRCCQKKVTPCLQQLV